MTREEATRERLEVVVDTLELIATKASLTPEQITNINLTAIAQLLADISLTLAIIADKLGGEGEGK